VALRACLQDPVPNVVAKPLANNLLEWRARPRAAICANRATASRVTALAGRSLVRC
jgi:hypothetical protein